MDPRWYVSCENPVEMMIIDAIIEKAIALQERRDKDLAINIGNELAKRMS